MHIKIKKQILENIINQLLAFVEKKDNTQITSHIFIKADKTLIFKATDKEIGLMIETENEIISKGEITINGKKFADIIKTLKNKEIEIKTENNKTIISQDNSIYKLSSFNTHEFPKFPPTENKTELKTNIKEFKEIIKKIYPVIDNNNPKYELNGALFDLKENSSFVSTDTRRLAVVFTKISTKEEKIIIPKRSIAEIKRIIEDDMKIYFNDTYLILKNKNKLFFTKLINGNFPTYERIIPKELKYEIKLSTKEFLSHLKQISIISNEVKIIITKDKVKIESISDETLQAKTEFKTDSNIEEFKFAVNSKYIIDFLNTIESEQFILGLNEPNIPFVLKEDNFITIVMPLNI
jgi:DNA polymerase-3 subunit beta